MKCQVGTAHGSVKFVRFRQRSIPRRDRTRWRWRDEGTARFPSPANRSRARRRATRWDAPPPALRRGRAQPRGSGREVGDAASAPLFSERDDRVARRVPRRARHHRPRRRIPPPRPLPRPPAANTSSPSGAASFLGLLLEVLKDGAIVDVVDCRGRSRLALGRTPDNDVVLEHPSSSRLHAVLQFSEGGDEIFLYDAGSTHGTFVNRRKLKSRVHAPVFVGDQIDSDNPRARSSSRRAGSCRGGLSATSDENSARWRRCPRKKRRVRCRRRRAQRRRRRRRRRRMAPPPVGAPPPTPSRRRRARARDARLARTPRRLHRKTTRKDRKDSKEEAKVEALKTEMECIRAKESESAPLSQGQRTTLARNESAVEKLEEEIEDMDETLNESLRVSMGAKSSAGAHGRGRARSGGRTRGRTKRRLGLGLGRRGRRG